MEGPPWEVEEGNSGDTKQLARTRGRFREQKKTSFVGFSFASPNSNCARGSHGCVTQDGKTEADPKDDSVHKGESCS